jgi:hypothetical protein
VWHFDLTAIELEGRLAEGTTFGFWTFDGKVPDPLLTLDAERQQRARPVRLQGASASGRRRSEEARRHRVRRHSADLPARPMLIAAI